MPLQKLLAGLMLLLGILAVEGVCWEMNPAPLASLALSYGVLLPALAIAAWTARQSRDYESGELPTLPPAAFLSLVGLMLLPWLTELLRQIILGFALPFEVAVMCALRNLALGLALATRWRSAARCALATAAIMSLAAASVALGDWVRWLLVGQGLCACLWLLLRYWRRLEGTEAARRFPVAIAGALIVLLVGITSLVVVGPERLATTLAALMPSSGGDQGQANNARGGLGDGDEVVKARHAPRSVGISDSDLVLETEQPSLYDLVTDRYGPPLKHKEIEQAESIQGTKQKQDFTVAENFKVSREFPLLRQPPKPRDEKSALPDALLYLTGPAPQHLRLQTYTEFDSEAWHPSEGTTAALPLKKEEGSNWFQLEYLEPAPLDAGEVRLAVKITKLGGNVFPLPGGVTRFRLGKISRADFFARTQSDLLCLAERNLPTGFKLEADVRTIAWDRAAEQDFSPGTKGYSIYRRLPEDWPLEEKLRALATSWAQGQPEGWSTIETIVQRLRSEYTLDSTYRPKPGCRDATEEFLFSSRRGPDYQFASAAALLLRTLGYRVRLVSGFYADPKRFDPELNHTLIQRDDVHTWLEVMGPGRQWLTLEPSPGYEVAAPFYPWHQRVWRLLTRCWSWLAARPVTIASTLFLILLTYLARRRLYDLAATAWWRLQRRTDWRQHTLATVHLLEQRARWADCPRPVGWSPRRWFERMEPANLRDWACLAEKALYSPAEVSVPLAEAQRQCDAAAATLTFQHLRRLARSNHPCESNHPSSSVVAWQPE